jgi:hypothetical protein
MLTWALAGSLDLAWEFSSILPLLPLPLSNVFTVIMPSSLKSAILIVPNLIRGTCKRIVLLSSHQERESTKYSSVSRAPFLAYAKSITLRSNACSIQPLQGRLQRHQYCCRHEASIGRQGEAYRYPVNRRLLEVTRVAFIVPSIIAARRIMVASSTLEAVYRVHKSGGEKCSKSTDVSKKQ